MKRAVIIFIFLLTSSALFLAFYNSTPSAEHRAKDFFDVYAKEECWKSYQLEGVNKIEIETGGFNVTGDVKYVDHLGVESYWVGFVIWKVQDPKTEVDFAVEFFKSWRNN